MSEPAQSVARSDLPDGWQFADWSEGAETRTFWESLDEKARQGFRVAATSVVMGIRYGEMPRHELAYPVKKSNGIWVVKSRRPNPGLRTFAFQDGDSWFVSHFDIKNHNDIETNVARAQRARMEQRARKAKQHGTNPPKRTA